MTQLALPVAFDIPTPARAWPADAGPFFSAHHPTARLDAVSIDRDPVTCPGCGYTWLAETVRSWWLTHVLCISCMHTDEAPHRLPHEAECERWRIEAWS